MGCPWGRLTLDRKHSSRQKSGSPCSSLTRYPCIPFSLLALGNFLKASGSDSWLCKLLMEQDPDITNRNSGLAGWCCSLFDPATAVGMSACPSSCHLSWQFAPLSHYLLVLTFIVKKKKSKEDFQINNKSGQTVFTPSWDRQSTLPQIGTSHNSGYEKAAHLQRLTNLFQT